MYNVKFLEAVDKAIEEKVVPQIFSAEQIAEMQLPYHEKYDHYSCANLVTSDKAFEKFHGVMPQLGINDPRISDQQIAAVPKNIKVNLDGIIYDIPLRIFKYTGAKNVQQWQKDLEFSYVSREAVTKLEFSLKQKFNLASGKDYFIGSGRGANKKNQPEAYYPVQLVSQDAQKQGGAIKKHIKEQLQIITPGRPSKVSTSGPIRAY